MSVRSAAAVVLLLWQSACAQEIRIARGRDGGDSQNLPFIDTGIISPKDGGALEAGALDAVAGPSDGGFFDAASFDGQARLDAQPGLDAQQSDAQRFDAAPGADALAPDGGGGLDPDLALPEPNGAVCTDPGSIGVCPGIAVCRFFTPQEGRCESCSPCGNLNAFCTLSSECDILFSCYLGRCTNFCTLGTSECGPPDHCINIGHPTRGVCLP